jgi:hypothetical protein
MPVAGNRLLTSFNHPTSDRDTEICSRYVVYLTNMSFLSLHAAHPRSQNMSQGKPVRNRILRVLLTHMYTFSFCSPKCVLVFAYIV